MLCSLNVFPQGCFSIIQTKPNAKLDTKTIWTTIPEQTLLNAIPPQSFVCIPIFFTCLSHAHEGHHHVHPVHRVRRTHLRNHRSGRSQTDAQVLVLPSSRPPTQTETERCAVSSSFYKVPCTVRVGVYLLAVLSGR